MKLDSFDSQFVRLVMEDEGYGGSRPHPLEDEVLQVFLVRAVVPEREIAVSVRVSRWRFHFSTKDTPST